MEKWFANTITDWCINKNKVSDIQEAAIRYGIELYFNTVIKIVFLLCLGAVFGKLLETIIVIFCFCLLRGEAGGIHMQTSMGCFLSMFGMTILSVIGNELLPELNLYVTLFGFIASLIIVFLYAPYTTLNNPITDRKIKQRKRVRAVSIVIILAIICVVYGTNLRTLILIPVIIEIITILPFWKRREEKIYAEREDTE